MARPSSTSLDTQGGAVDPADIDPRAIAVLGTGVMAAVHSLAARASGISVRAFGSRDPGASHPQVAGMGVPIIAADRLPAGAGTVVVATPPFRHGVDALAMLGRGANVIVETPFTTTLGQADQLVAAGGARVGYAENLVFTPILAAVHARVARLGALTHLEVRALQDRPMNAAVTTDAWGGGALFDLGSHPLAVAMMLAAPAVVTSVRGTLRGWNGTGPRHDSDEHAEVELTFSNRLRAVVIASWQASSPLWDVQASSATGVVRAEIKPETMLEVNGDRHEVTRARREPAVIEELGYGPQLHSMLSDFAGRRAPLSDALFGRAVLDITCACYASAGSGGAAISVPFSGPRHRTPLELWRGN